MANFTAEKAAEKIALAKLVSRLACVPTSEEVAGEGFVLDRAELDALIVACRRLENGEPEEASIVLAESASHSRNGWHHWAPFIEF